MKSKIAICGLLIAGCIGSANANKTDFYAGITGGIGGQSYFADGDNSSKSATAYGAMFGIDVPLVRAELEYNRFDTKEFATNATMANMYFKLMPSPVVSPYVGIGAGLQFGGKVKEFDADTKNNWAAQAMAGLTFGIPATSLFIDTEIRAMYLPEIATKVDAVHYDFRLKARYAF